MSKSLIFPNELIVDGKSIMGYKDSDGKIRSVCLIMDFDYNKDEDASLILDTVSPRLLQEYDRLDSYNWNYSDCSYFCDESYL